MALAWINIVIDVEPRSRYSALPDVGHMIVSGRTLDVGPLGGAAPTSIQDIYPTRDPLNDDRFRLSFTVPPAGIDVVKNGAMTVVVLFPQSTSLYRVRVDATNTDPAPTLIDVGGRQAAVWNLTQDPDIDIDYIYDMITHEE